MPSVYVPPHIDGSMEADRFTTLLEGGRGVYVGKDGYEAPLHSYSYYGEWRRTPHHLRYTALHDAERQTCFRL